MSALELSPRGSADLLDIDLQGIRAFGPRQADHYVDDFDRRLAVLAANPRMGRKADAVANGVRRHGQMAHVIFYEETATGILVVAVLHA